MTSVYGVFVIETKHYGGWIFGDEYKPYSNMSNLFEVSTASSSSIASNTNQNCFKNWQLNNSNLPEIKEF